MPTVEIDPADASRVREIFGTGPGNVNQIVTYGNGFSVASPLGVYLKDSYDYSQGRYFVTGSNVRTISVSKDEINWRRDPRTAPSTSVGDGTSCC
jgi:hypothetical protein